MTELPNDDEASDQDRARAWAAKMLAMPDLLILKQTKLCPDR